MDDLLKPTRMRATQLDAWPVISSALFDFTPASDDIISIVGRAGLNVDWNLNPKEAYSHSTRKRAYRPRVHAAYSELNPEDRDTVLSLIIGELAHRFPAHAEVIKTGLARVGWTLKAVAEPKQNTGEPVLPMKRIKDLQRLLLLQVRDGKEPPGLAQYSEQDQVYNSALLINDGYVEGEAIQGGSGEYVSTVMIQLTSKGHDFLEETDSPQRQPAAEIVIERKNSKLIFVSHSSADEDLAEAVVDMLCSALHLRRGDFLCTSVEGAKLRGGDDTDDVLRNEIREVPVFLSLLSRKAMVSTYVLFELGARWGFRKHHIPLLAKGAGTDVLKEPLKAKNALQLSNEADVLQLVEDLAAFLKLKPEAANSYLKKARRIVDISLAGANSAESIAVQSSFAGGGDPGLGIELLAKARLKQCAGVLKNAQDLNSALNNLRELQKFLKPEREQITVVANEQIALHAAPNLENRPIAGAWEDVNGQSLYLGMKSLRSGITTTRIKGWHNRLTAIAFEQFNNPPCMIVVEAHHQQ